MCGILCTLLQNYGGDHITHPDYEKCKPGIERRGPDSFSEITENLPLNWSASFAASVLWMQGAEPFPQPCKDGDGNVLLWNGDIFSGLLASDSISDTQKISTALRDVEIIPLILKEVRGPYSLIYYKAMHRKLYFARDPIGRHSLLVTLNSDCTSLTLSSCATKDCKSVEVPAIGVFVFDLETRRLSVQLWKARTKLSESLLRNFEALLGVEIKTFEESEEKTVDELYEPFAQDIAYLESALDSAVAKNNLTSEVLSCESKKSVISTLEIFSKVMESLASIPEVQQRVTKVLQLLRDSVRVRIKKKQKFCKNCVRKHLNNEEVICDHSKLGILFSGGLDSTVLAAIADEFVPRDESIDLMNVAFEKNETVKKFDVPDRITGRKSLEELRKLFPWREWNFVESDVKLEDLQEHRPGVIRDLVHPLKTVLDDSLGCALWFASRGSGFLENSSREFYVSPARVLLVGMGADELFGGYTRHRTTLRRAGWAALSEELDLEVERISERNLGRDDRVISDHGRQSRLPYLDEELVKYVRNLPAWERCYPTERMQQGLGDKLLLRLVARELGLRESSNFPKRAFQFGSRIAKRKENAKDESNWL